MSMGTSVKYKGRWISMERAIKLKAQETKSTVEESKVDTLDVVDETEQKEPTVEESKVDTPTTDIKIASEEHTLEELRNRYIKLYGGLSKRFWNNKEWLITQINKI